MKTIILLNFLFLSVEIFAQQSGNARVYGNNEYNNAYNNYQNQPTQISPISQITSIGDSTFIISVNVLMNVKASEYVAILGLAQSGKTVKDCNELMNSRLDGVLSELKSVGFQIEDIYVDFITQVPIYEVEIEKKLFSKTANEIPAGFELKKNIHIRYKKSEQLDQIMAVAAKFEVYDLVKVDYHIASIEPIYDTLRSKALTLIKKKAQHFAEINLLTKSENLKFQTIAEDIAAAYPEERYATYTAYNTTGIKRNIKTKNEIEKQTTSYYSKVNYKSYDLVIHPVIVEPVIQFSYSLKVKYSLKKR